MKAPHLCILPEVSDALSAGEAVVALESTLISHGLPEPRNIETARSSSAAVRDAGAVPATVAVLDGKLKVGLQPSDLERLAHEGKSMAKLSRRDLALALASGQSGATTVAATMIAARAAGIKVFATGGIGGVHVGASESFDVSADLAELARTDVIVVCSGAKAILDLPRTREVLETLGVPVLGYRTDKMPGFWYAKTELPVDQRVNDLAQLTAIVKARDELKLGGGMLLCNPPPDKLALDKHQVEDWIAKAHSKARDKKVHGKDLTPFLLAAVAKASGNKTLETNIALIVANAALAGAVACVLCRR